MLKNLELRMGKNRVNNYVASPRIIRNQESKAMSRKPPNIPLNSCSEYLDEHESLLFFSEKVFEEDKVEPTKGCDFFSIYWCSECLDEHEELLFFTDQMFDEEKLTKVVQPINTKSKQGLGMREVPTRTTKQNVCV